jgi:hypothetical protein
VEHDGLFNDEGFDELVFERHLAGDAQATKWGQTATDGARIQNRFSRAANNCLLSGTFCITRWRDQQVLRTKTSELRACKHDRFFWEAFSQPGSASRFTAAGAGFYDLSQSGDRPGRPILLSVRPPIPGVPS